MIVEYFDYEIDVPESMIADYVEKFQPLSDGAMKSEADILRDSIFYIFELIELVPDLLDESKYYIDFTHAIAMREALKSIKILHNA